MSSNKRVTLSEGMQSLGGGAGLSKSKSETVNYLLLYEAMVRNQDLEFDATHDHIALTVGRIRHLGRRSVAKRGVVVSAPGLVDEIADDDPREGMLTYPQMRRCLLRLGYTWNRSVLSGPTPSVASGASLQYYDGYDDDVSVASAGSASSFGGGSQSSLTSGGVGGARDIVATDAQLIMLLTTLVEMEERHRAAGIEGGAGIEGEDAYAGGLFLPEFIQAYKLIVGGMQSLQSYPDEGDAVACTAMGVAPGDAPSVLTELRTRSRDRTLGLLKLFGPEGLPDPGAAQQPAGEDPMSGKRGGEKGKSPQVSGRGNGKGGKKGRGKTAKDGLAPRLSEEEIKKLVHSKDKVLAKVLEEHESEMNVMAVNMEELRIRGLRTQKLIRTRRRRTRIAAVAIALVATAGGGAYEYHRREQVRVEIAEGREAERVTDAARIRLLEKEAAGLASKLGDAEATIRYEEGRHADVKGKYERMVKTLEDSETRWQSERGELERCRVTRKGMDAELTSVRAMTEEVEEEVRWCRERLAGAERAMEGMERALTKSRKEGSGTDVVVVPSFKDIAREIKDEEKSSGENTDGSGDGKKGGKIKPVKMEMKYNKSFRNAVILRQAYAALAGAAVSALIPVVFKALWLLL